MVKRTIDIIGKIPIWNTFQLMHNGLRAFNQNVPFLFPGSEVPGRPLPQGENALHRTLQEKRDQFQAKVLLAFECISPYFSTSTRSLFLNSKILICDKKQADSAVVVLLGSLWTS